jgi:hypothetical protein
MPIPFQSWLENAILLIILVLNPIVTTEVRVLLMTIIAERGFVPEQRQYTTHYSHGLLEQTVFMVRGTLD